MRRDGALIVTTTGVKKKTIIMYLSLTKSFTFFGQALFYNCAIFLCSTLFKRAPIAPENPQSFKKIGLCFFKIV